MLINKESKLFTIVFFIVFIASIIFGYSINEGILYIIFQEVLIIIIYISGIYSLNKINKDIVNIRHFTEKTENCFEKYDEGEIGKLAGSIESVRHKLEEAEQRQRREKEFLRDIISDISHQIKTPVSALTVFNDIMLDAIEDEKLRNILLQSELQLERITWLVEAMLKLARIEAESVVFEKKPVDINKLLISCANMLKIRADEKKIDFNINGQAMLSIDEEWTKEAIINIMKNAIDYGPAKSDIEITIKQTPISTKLIIKDYGNGIEEKDRLNIFKRFYRAATNEVNPNSVGIGLSLAKSIIEGQDGKIWVESRHISECIKDEQSYTSMVIMF